MPIEFIAGLIIGISMGMDLALFIQQIKQLRKEWRNNK